MDNYGLDMQGKVFVERLDEREDWTSDDIGRLIMDYSTGLFYVGGKDATYGEEGWIPVGSSDSSVTYSMINWDKALLGTEDTVSSLNIPCLYGDTTSTVQTCVNSILDEITSLSKGEILQSEAIKSYHLDVSGTYGIDARTIPIKNADGYFSSSITTTEDALIYLTTKDAGDISLQENGGFGETVGFTSDTVQGAFVEIESYLSTISADSIKATYSLSTEASTVQFILDAHYQLINNVEFKNLIGTPTDYGTSGQILKTDGIDSVCFDDLVANDISCSYPATTPSNIQTAIWGLQEAIDTLEDSFGTSAVYDSSDITYSGNADYETVDSVLDYLLSTTYRSDNAPNALDVSSIGISDTTNVQDALVYLLAQFNELMTQLPCQLVSSEIQYTSPAGHSDVKSALDYLFSVL